MAIIFDSLITELLIAVVSIFGAIYWYFTKDFDYWEKRNVPFLKPQAFFGNFKDRWLLREPVSTALIRTYNDLKKYKIGGVWQLKQPVLFVTDPETIKRILVKDFAHFHDRGMVVDEKNNPLSAHLFNLSGTRWRTLRAKLTPTFTSGKMKMMFGLMRECALEFSNYVEREAQSTKDIEFREIFAKMTTDIIGTCAFGLNCNSMKDSDSEFRKMGREAFSPPTHVIILQIVGHLFPTVGKLFGIQFPQHHIREFFMRVVKETVSYRENNNIQRSDFMQLLIDLKNKKQIQDDGQDKLITAKGLADEKDIKNFELTDNLLAAQAFVFFLAGFETSSTTMSFALYELVMNLDIQAKLRADIDRALQKSGGEFTYDAIKDMEYLDKVVNESLRKYPPVPSLSRVCTQRYEEPESGLVVEEGTKLEIPVFGLHHDPDLYPDPERFDPERFSKDTAAARHPFAFLPFGEGPRICIGMRFGLLQAKLGLAALVARFELLPSPLSPADQPLEPKSFITRLRGGVYARVVPRSRCGALARLYVRVHESIPSGEAIRSAR